MADLVTRLRLDNKEFDDNIRKSKQQLDTFKNIGSSVASSIKSLGMQFAAAAGLMEGLSTAVNSNSVLQEEWQDAIGTAKESVDSFFTSLASGDWSLFENGIVNAINLSRQYQQSLRQLKTSIKIGDVRISQDEKDMNKYENIMNDENASKSDRDTAFEYFKSLGNETIAYTQRLSSFVNQEFNNMLKGKGVKPSDNVRKMVFDYLDPSTMKGQLLKKYESLYNEVQKASAGANAVATNPLEAQVKAMSVEKLKESKKQLDSLSKSFPELNNAFKLKLNFGTDEELDTLLDLMDKIIGYQDRTESLTKQLQDGVKDYTEGKGGTNVKVTPIIPSNSLAEIEKQISDAKARLKLAVDEPSRIRLYKEIKELEGKERVIRFRYEHSGSKGAEFINPAKGSLASMAKMPEMKITSSDDKKLDKRAKAADKYANALSNCASAVAAFNSQKLEDTGEGWTQWSSNLLAAAASTIAGLMSLTAAEGVESAFKLPFPANIAAGAMVLSTVMSLFASIPAFASGGIFESPLTSGDRNLARLNGGEMILNKGQQYSLFKLLDNGTPINGNGGQVQFRISGKELVGVLSNYNNKVSKVR